VWKGCGLGTVVTEGGGMVTMIAPLRLSRKMEATSAGYPATHISLGSVIRNNQT
jgi:hypothetical protein